MKNLNIQYRKLALTFDKFSWIKKSTIQSMQSVIKPLKTSISVESRLYDLYRVESMYRLVPQMLSDDVETILLKSVS